MLLDVNAKMHKAKTFGAVYVAMQCQEPVCSALSRWIRQILHIVIQLLCNKQLLERHASSNKIFTTALRIEDPNDVPMRESTIDDGDPSTARITW